jgi:TatD DNase family protein
MSNLKLIDSHAHLDFKDFVNDQADTIQRAKEVGVFRIINIGTSLATSRHSVELAQNHATVYATVGIHPHDSKEVTKENLAKLRILSQQPKVVAIGEIGLDYFKMYQQVDIQERAFRAQLELALELKLPVVIHTRAADSATIEMLQNIQSANWEGVFHCFPGDVAMARQVLDLGFHISFTGVITFKNSTASEVIRYIPFEKLLIETDCPFMTPVPHRGKRNEPAYVYFVAQKIAEIKGVSLERVAELTTTNTERIFKIGECTS